jgi:hypothetical protein
MLGNFSNGLWVLAGAFLVLLIPTPALSHHPGHHRCGQATGCDYSFDDHHLCGHAGMRAQTGCEFCFQGVDRSSATTVQGKVESVYLGPGQGSPHIEIVTDQGNKLDLWVAPFWYLSDQGFEIKAGDRLTVSMAKVNTSDGNRNVALELKQKDGKTVKLRDENGFPMWMKGNRTGWPCRM